MKPSILLAILALVVLGAVAIFSGLFDDAASSSDPKPAATEKDAPPAKDPKSDAPEVVVKTQEPAATNREVVRDDKPAQTSDSRGSAMIGGRVVTATEQGVPDAVVTLFVGPSNPAFQVVAARRPTGLTAKTDSDGAYSFENVADSPNYVITAVHPDYAQGERTGIAVAENDAVVAPNIVLGEGSKLKGLVRDLTTQAPIAGAKLELWDTMTTNFLDVSLRKPWATTESDPNGNYEFKNVHFNAYEIVCAKDGYASMVKREAQLFLAAAPASVRDFNFELPYAVKIAGIVTDTRGQRVPDALINADQIGQVAERGGSKGAATSGPDGRFEINTLGEGTYQVSAQAKGYSPKQVGQFNSGTTDLTVALEPRGTVRGKVAQPNGGPVTKFELRLVMVREAEPIPTNQTQRFTSNDGSFSMGDAEPGDYMLEATADGFAPTRSQKFTVDRERSTDGVSITMTVGGTVTGTVQNSRGEPVAGAEITINPNNYQSNFITDIFGSLPSSPQIKTPKTRTGKDGRFEIKHVTPGTYQVAVKARDYSPFAKNDVAIPEGPVDIGTIRLSSGGTIEGNCVDASGRPFADGVITASMAQTPDRPAQSMPSMKTIKPDFDGKFRLSNLDPGDWELTLGPDSLDGVPINPLTKVMMTQQTKQLVPVRDGQISTVTMKVPPAPK